jgi:glycosyltransferase involved in cell wall biosynthesis
MCESSITRKMNQPLLHVMIPVYGYSPYLKAALQSAVSHLPESIPITVIEDPSSDADNYLLVSEFKRVKYIKNSTRLGIAENFNKCLIKSEGIYTQILGSDDIIKGEALDCIEKELTKPHPAELIINSASVINDKGYKTRNLTDLMKSLVAPKLKNKIFTNKQFLRSMVIGDWAYFPSIYWQTVSTVKIGFSGRFHTAMDLAMFFEYCRRDIRILFSNKNIINYRRHSESASSKYSFDSNRYLEEFECQRIAKNIAIQNKWKAEALLAELALTIRMHLILKIIMSLTIKPSDLLRKIKLVLRRLPE